MKSRLCEICQKVFYVKYPSSKTKTCGLECKRELNRVKAKKQFADPEARKNHSKKAKELHNDPEYAKKYKKGIENRVSYEGEGNPTYGLPRTRKWRRNISTAKKGRMKYKSWDEIMDPKTVARRRRENALNAARMNANNPSLGSEFERKIAALLHPPHFAHNKQIDRYVVDFISEKHKLIVEIYGDYWHCNPRIFKPDYVHRSLGIAAKDVWQNDSMRKKFLENLGYKVLVFWEKDLKENGMASILRNPHVRKAFS